ncbi:DsbE family thiol:disulfide interchange protein [Methylopila henanensis]|uniref:DsbE family thiol:disulfide interchange protein n=1 Tax=Methylopila henanensis TaxID=873516 RepID=A0ABW4K9G5_9HYPH
MSEAPSTGAPSLLRRALFAIPFVAVALGAWFFYASLVSGRDPSALPSALIGRPAPELALPPLAGLLLDGKPSPGFDGTDLADGEVKLVNVFASWCGPCRVEHPVLVDLKSKGVRLFGLNYKDTAENARRFLGGLGNPYERVGVDPNGRAGVEWGVYGVPETFVVDGEGRIRFKFVGPLTPEAVAKTLSPEIAKARAPAPQASAR